jgi:hypothetical protein
MSAVIVGYTGNSTEGTNGSRMIIVKGGWMDWGESTSLTFKINNVI